jgi:hypothetical protein
MQQLSFIRSTVCLAIGPLTLPKPDLHILRPGASSFNSQYPLIFIRSSSGCLCRPPRLPVTSKFPPISHSLMCSFYAKCDQFLLEPCRGGWVGPMDGLEVWRRYINKCLTRCNYTQVILSVNCCTCFGWFLHPSSGAQIIVSTASRTSQPLLLPIAIVGQLWQLATAVD